MGNKPAPVDTDVPGGFPETPPVNPLQEPPPGPQSPLVEPSNWISARRSSEGGESAIASGRHDIGRSPSLRSGIRAVHETNASGTSPHSHVSADVASQPISSSSQVDSESTTAVEPYFEPLKTTAACPGNKRSTVEQGKSSITTEEDLFRVISRRRSSFSRGESKEEREEIERLMSRLFGEARQRQSEEEKTRHAGVIFRDLTVKGVGLGASLQPTVGDIFLGLPRFLKNLFTKGPKAAIAKPPVRDLISNFTGCTFCNQRAGFEDVLGDVTYGGTDAKTMAKDFRVLLSGLALLERSQGWKGESRKDYVKEFLRVATKLLWIEHTLDTKVGDEYIRGVSGGERKRVSIAEALITRASVLVMLCDKASLFGKWGGIIFQGVVVGSLFYNLPDNTAGAFRRGGVLFFILLFNALLALAELTAAFESKPILLKHKNFSFYQPSAYALAQTIVDIPLVLVQVVLLAVIIYWMAGLSATPSQFFISILILWLVTMTAYAFFRAILAVFKTLDDATKFKVLLKLAAGGGGTVSDEETGRVNEKAAPPEQNAKGHEQRDKEVLNNVAKNEKIFTFQDVDYAIPFQGGERKLQQNVQGYVRPGKLTALMGASGSGKTTLLNALAQRSVRNWIKFGVITGNFLVDRKPLPKSFQRATGFSEQLDIPGTVRGALPFSALLRQPKEVVKEEKYAYCETIIELLEMQDIAGATIGKVGEGLNSEQRKRLTIGVKLASKPELLMFLDEPTSGLDSGAAFNIVRFLRKLADAGQAILCTIHQPSAVLFENFDELILLESGGRVVYAGDLGKGSQKLISYFEENGGSKCPPDANPAEWVLDTIGAGNPDYKGQDWGSTWLQSRKYEEQSRGIAEIVEKRKNADHSRNVRDDREYTMSLWTQTTAVVKRSFVAYWRRLNYIMGKFILQIFTGLFNSFTFYKLGYATIDMQSHLFSIFMTLTISPPLIQQLQPVFLHSRDIFQSRENNAKIYSWFAWTTVALLVEIPYAIVAGAIYFNCWWWGVMGNRNLGFTSGFTFLCIMLFELYYVGFGQAIASFSPNELLASLLVPIFFLFVVSFCGVVVPSA
ncbi:hypothetical protein DL762_009937 [Monosporascus cannonballus]|uniref:ABC transporter domain-containing protein n=1 Tax=Monosporascus cannonballus TaxID=155416 RepID=A0ABY0GSB3_9PEZI|nr:hypothetical protein DL762_009937 [Monosporascus cannonballus]